MPIISNYVRSIEYFKEKTKTYNENSSTIKSCFLNKKMLKPRNSF